MNDRKRKSIRSARALLSQVSEIITIVLEDEQDCLDNIPENLLDSEGYEKIAEAVDYLDAVVSLLCEADETLDKASA